MSNYYDRQPLLGKTFATLKKMAGVIALNGKVFTAEEDAAWTMNAGFSRNMRLETIVGRKATVQLPEYTRSTRLGVTARVYNNTIDGWPNGTFVYGQLHLGLDENDTDNPIAGFDYALLEQREVTRINRFNLVESNEQPASYETLLADLGVSGDYAQAGRTEAFTIGEREGHNLVQLIQKIIRDGRPA